MHILYLVLLLCVPFNIVLHEASHCLYYLVNGIRIRAIVINKLVLVRTNTAWKLGKCESISSNYILPKIESNKNLCFYIDKMKNGLLFGPFVTVCLLIVWLIILISYSFIGNADVMIVVIIWFNIAANLSILQGCFKIREDAIGDITAYKLFKKNKKRIYPYILDYCMYSLEICADFKELLDTDISELDEQEKIDWVFDIVVLFMMGRIPDINFPKGYIEDILKKETDKDGVVSYVFKLYLFSQGMSAYYPVEYKIKNPMEKIFELLEIHKMIGERIDVKSE